MVIRHVYLECAFFILRTYETIIEKELLNKKSPTDHAVG